MTTLLVVVLVGTTVATLLGLAVALVAATDRLRRTVDRLLAVRGVVQPQLVQLRDEAERARAHADRIRAARWRAGGEQGGQGSQPGPTGGDGVPSGPQAR